MVDANPDGEHMTLETFAKVIEFVRKYNLMALLISGGEPLEHPQFFEIGRMAKESGLVTMILSNGMFVEDEETRDKVLDLGFMVQITNDPRFYPQRIQKFEHELFGYEDTLRIVSPQGRAAKNNIEASRLTPTCFNLRSCARSLPTFQIATLTLRQNQKMCTPSINVDGSVVAGESSSCYKIGTVESTDEELLANLRNMVCNKCGLENNLEDYHKVAIYGKRIIAE
jgi:hypothetical protein